MRQLRAWIFPAALAWLVLLVSGCAKPADAKKPKYTDVNEAYSLLDQGQTSRAIMLLEPLVRGQPDNDEARLLLASAYMGRAGIDVLSLHEAFHDVLFSRSLSDVFFSGGGRKGPRDPLTGSQLPNTQRGRDDTPAEKLFQDLDEFLNNVRRVLSIFDRFPHIPERKWPLMDQALFHLDQLPPQREVRIYRMFVRLVYFKEMVVTRVLRDPSFGTRIWACQLEASSLNEALLWISDTLAKVSDDFVQVYPRDASPFVRVQAVFEELNEELAHLEAATPAGGETSMVIAQRRLREALRCDQLAR